MTIPFPENRGVWWDDARYGLFIHWGLYAVHGHGEWAMSREAVPWDSYRQHTEAFTASAYDPAAWATMAKAAGMRYAVLTTKHHEGFCLWDSPTCAFNAVKSAAKRDLLREFVDAFRAAGIKVGFYYSLGDWFHPDWERAVVHGDVAARRRFVAYTHALVEELMTCYGTIDILWYDLPQGLTSDQWRMVELNAKVRAWQPGILINNRGYTTEDFATPEQHAAASAKGRRWESCMTLNNHWGYCPVDTAWKSPRSIASTLATCASGCGNLLLNVGPDPQGRIPERAGEILRDAGAWLARHEEAIRGTDRHDLFWYVFGKVSVKGNSLYCFVEQWYGEGTFVVGGLTNRVLKATLVGSGANLPFVQNGRQTIVEVPRERPDPVLPVIRLDLDGVPDHDISRVIGRADIFPELPV